MPLVEDQWLGFVNWNGDLVASDRNYISFDWDSAVGNYDSEFGMSPVLIERALALLSGKSSIKPLLGFGIAVFSKKDRIDLEPQFLKFLQLLREIRIKPLDDRDLKNLTTLPGASSEKAQELLKTLRLSRSDDKDAPKYATCERALRI